MKQLLYENPLNSLKFIADWIDEGNILKEIDDGLILSSKDSEELGDHAHWTIWLPEEFPDNISIEWDFKPIEEPGLCMIFFSALGKKGESIFDKGLSQRDGYYPQYHSGDINTYHISYLRHKYETERAFRTCNLRKSAGFNLAVQGADPLPPTEDAVGYYHIRVNKLGNHIQFLINELLLFDWWDDGDTYGPVLGKGNIGFRQMAPMKAEYKNLRIFNIDTI